MGINVSTPAPRGQTPAPAVTAASGKQCFSFKEAHIWVALNCRTGCILREGEVAQHIIVVVPTVGYCEDDDNPWAQISLKNGSTTVEELAGMTYVSCLTANPSLKFLATLLETAAGAVAISEVEQLRKKQYQDEQDAYRKLELDSELQEAQRIAFNLEMSKLNKL